MDWCKGVLKRPGETKVRKPAFSLPLEEDIGNLCKPTCLVVLASSCGCSLKLLTYALDVFIQATVGSPHTAMRVVHLE